LQRTRLGGSGGAAPDGALAACARQTGEMGFATLTDWEYYGGARNPLDPATPSRTLDASGTTVRLFAARVARGSLQGARVQLKEFFPRAEDIARQELRVYTDLIQSCPGSPRAPRAPARSRARALAPLQLIPPPLPPPPAAQTLKATRRRRC
jgi:hypothetical protein